METLLETEIGRLDALGDSVKVRLEHKVTGIEQPNFGRRQVTLVCHRPALFIAITSPSPCARFTPRRRLLGDSANLIVAVN